MGGEGRWFTLVQMRIMTGRTHQIRVHMAFLGHPLVGDGKYGAASTMEKDFALVPRIFLHCLRMEFEDIDGSTFVAVSDLAADLQVALGRIQAMATDPPVEVVPPLEEAAVKSTVCEYLASEKSAQKSRILSNGFYGLQGLLNDSSHRAPAGENNVEDDACQPLPTPATIVYKCDN